MTKPLASSSPTPGPFEWSAGTIAGAAELHRLRDARVGADRQNSGKYAAYFYDEDGQEIRSAGQFESVDAAAWGVWLIQAEAVLEACGLMEADQPRDRACVRCGGVFGVGGHGPGFCIDQSERDRAEAS